MDLTKASVIADSTNLLGNRLITIDMVYPAIVHQYVVSYSSFAKSSNDMRCMTPSSLVHQVRDEGFVPQSWRRAGPKGHLPQGKLSGLSAAYVEAKWREAMVDAINLAEEFASRRVAREITNRILEPFAWLRTVATADETMWNNFLQHRTSLFEQSEIRALASKVASAISSSKTVELAKGGWHIPFDNGSVDDMARIVTSVARCAKMAFRTPRLGNWSEIEDETSDRRLFARLQRMSDWSHFEHQALCWLPEFYRNDYDEAVPSRLRGKFSDGWIQFRKTVSGEVFTTYKAISAKDQSSSVQGEKGGASWERFTRELSVLLEKEFRTKSR